MKKRRVALAAIPATLAVALSGVAHADAAARGHGHDRSVAAFHAARPAGAGDEDIPVIGSCKLLVPSTARVVQDEFDIPVSVTGGCALHDGPIAAWSVGTEDNLSDFLFFADEKRTSWQLYNDTPLGVRTWQDEGAFNSDGTAQYTQNSPQTTVKVGSWAGLNTSRSGNRVTLNTRVVRYATSLDHNIPYAGKGGVIQYRVVGGSSWTSLKNVTAGSDGNYSYSYTSSSVRDYRVVYGESTYIWGATSPTSRR